MVKTNDITIIKNYKKSGIIAAVVVVVAALGIWAIAGRHHEVTVDEAIAEVSDKAMSGAEMRIAVINMDKVTANAVSFKSIQDQRENYEKKLRDELTKEQKALEKEKSEIEKSQDVLSQDALQRRVVDYQKRVTNLQRTLNERAQSIAESSQKALEELQKKHLDPVIDGIIAKKNLSLVIDGRIAKTGADAGALDITDEVVNALNKKVSNIKLATPKGF